jgi:hypothetical protein
MKSTATHPLAASFIGTMLEFCLRLGLEIQRLCFRIALPNQRPAATALCKPPMHPETADQALRYFLTVARLAGARVFLISGTLLGFYRSGRLLGHDKDIDLGVMWDDPALPALLAALRSSDHLQLYATVRVGLLAALMNPQLPSLPDGTLSFKYDYFSGNGKRVRIDLFVHFPMGSEIVHGSCRTLWGNSPFTLSEHGIGEEIFLLPSNREKYLAENYGDFHTERRMFESSVDCPNARNCLSLVGMAFLLRKHWQFQALRDSERVALIAKRIESLAAFCRGDINA